MEKKDPPIDLATEFFGIPISVWITIFLMVLMVIGVWRLRR